MFLALNVIGIIKISKMLIQHSLVTICKAFVLPHLNHGDIIYDHPNYESFNQKLREFSKMLLL